MENFFYGVASTLILVAIGAGYVEYRAAQFQALAARRIDKFLDEAEARVINGVSERLERKLEDEYSGQGTLRRNNAF